MVHDLLLLLAFAVGCLLIAAGVWLIFVPAGLIVAGALVLAVALQLARTGPEAPAGATDDDAGAHDQ